MMEKLDTCLGQNIFRLDLDRAEKRLRDDVRLRDVRVERRLPGRILVEVEEKTPVLWISLPARSSGPENCGFCGLSIDQEYIPLGQNELSNDLPIVSGIEIRTRQPGSNRAPQPYQRWSDPKAEKALEFYKCVTGIDPALSGLLAELNLDDALNVTLYLLSGTQVMMGHDDFEIKWRRARTVLAGEENVEKLACLDLRFDDQVVLAASSTRSPSPRR
jgi:cell division septal protein FtsQ